jgi:hypothetical protein
VYEVKNGKLYSGRKKLGNSESIYVDGRQDVAGYIKRSGRKKVLVAELPEGDYVMVTPSGLTVGIEEKKPGDLASSLRSRRLQRQLRRLEKSVDIPLLGLRFMGGRGFTPHWWQWGSLNMPIELLKWSLRGGIILLPKSDELLIKTLRRARNILQPGKHLFSIVAGSDKKITGSTGFNRAVQRMIEGVGPSTAGKIEKYYNGSMHKLLTDNEEGWSEAGLNIRQKANLEELLNEDERNKT